MTGLWLLVSSAAGVVGALVVGTVGVVAARGLSPRTRALGEGWQGAARELGLTAAPTVELCGEVDGLPVQVRLGTEGDLPCEIAVAGVPTDLRLGSASRGAPASHGPTGDPRWDAHGRASVTDVRALARLTHPVRERTVPLLAHGRLRVEDGFVLLLAGPGPLDRVALVAAVRQGVGLAHALRRTERPLDGLLEEAFRGDPVPGVQARSLEILTRHVGGPLAREASIAALSHPNPRIRLLGARHLHRWDLLVGVAWDPRSGPDLRREAVDLLIWARQGLAREILGPVLAEGGPGLWEQAARCAAAYQSSEAVPALAGLVGDVIGAGTVRSDPGGRAAALAVAEALGALGAEHPCAEEALLELAAFPDARLRRTALRALAQVGTQAAVAPLQQYLATSHPRTVRALARTAVRAASGRSGLQIRGAVSLAAVPHSGWLALPAEAGRLRLVTEE